MAATGAEPSWSSVGQAGRVMSVRTKPAGPPGRLAGFVDVAGAFVLVALVGTAWGALVIAQDDFYCPHPTRDSDYGELSWSVLPPGPQCTWSTESGNHVDDARGPTPVMSVWLATLAVLGWCVVRTAYRIRPRTPVDDVHARGWR